MNLRSVGCVFAVAITLPVSFGQPMAGHSQGATPGATYSCQTATTSSATPGPASGTMPGMVMGNPMAGMDGEMEMGIELLYIEMMIPHHASIIAMAEAALPRLSDERLQDIARAIIEAQSAEIEELHGLRQNLSGSSTPMTMDDMSMAMMLEMMPGMGTMAEMAMQMDPVAQVTAICEAGHPDLAFIELTIPHHEMAIIASEAVLEQSANAEVRAFAERVIADQQREIETLSEIRDGR